MSQPTVVHTDRAPAAIGPYSQAVAAGDLVFCSGQIPVIPESGALVEGDVTRQTEQVLTNLSAVLGAAGSSLGQVLKTTVFLADLQDFGAMNEVYARRFGDHRPARSTIEVAGLPRGALVEIECVALRTGRK